MAAIVPIFVPGLPEYLRRGRQKYSGHDRRHGKVGQAVEVDQTPKAAIITTTLPIASLREHSQTERTLASPSL